MDASVPEKEQELMGGLMNAINRGETLDQARFSFLNAGYNKQIVDMAARRLMGESGGETPSVPSSEQAPASNLSLYATNDLQKPAATPASKQKESPKRYSHMPVPYWAVILMLLISLGIVIGAGILGLYWHRLFPG